MLSEPVVKSILSYRDTVESVSSFSVFGAFRNRLKKFLLMAGVFLDLLHHDLAAIPLGELELSLPPMTCYTATSMCARCYTPSFRHCSTFLLPLQ